MSTPTRDWRDDAACADVATVVFYPVQYGGPRRRGQPIDLYHQARPICAACPVRSRCESYAIENDEREGMWGGLTPEDRQRLLKGLRPIDPTVRQRGQWAKAKRKAWRNPEHRAKRAEYMRQYRANAAETLAAQNKRWADANRDRVRERGRANTAAYRARKAAG